MRPRTANLLAAYAAVPGVTKTPSIDEMFTIDPPPPARIGAIAGADAEERAELVHLEHAAESSTDVSAMPAGCRTAALLTSSRDVVASTDERRPVVLAA